MRCAINAEPMFQRVPTGVGVYTHSLLRGLAEIGRGDQVVLFHAHHAALPSTVDELPMRRFAFGLEREPLYRSWHEQHRPAPQTVTGEVDVVHAPGPAVPPHGSARLVATIHDLAPLRFPERYSPTARVTLKRGALTAARDAGIIVCPSRSTAMEVEALLDVDPARIRVVPHGVQHLGEGEPSESEVRAVLDGLGVTRPYLLWVGTQEERKNVHAVLDAFAQVAPGHPDLRLVLHGPSGWLGAEVAEGIGRRGISERTVVSEGSVSERDLAALYTGAFAFVFPSLYEGFGLPVLEAMACGAPVITSNQSALPECVGDAGLTVDPLDHDALAAAIESVLADDHLRKDLGERGRARAAGFTWAETARRTWAVYEELAEGSAP